MATAVLAALAFAAPATAATGDADLAIPTGTRIVSGVPAGDVVELTEVATGPLAGRTCDVRAVRGAAGAVHDGNDLIVRSLGGGLVLPDVEREPGATTRGTDPIELGPAVAIALRMGPDEQFAGDVVVELACAPVVASFGVPGGADAGVPSRLPLTGRDIAVIAAIGTGLVAVGALATIAVRRRRDPPPAIG